MDPGNDSTTVTVDNLTSVQQNATAGAPEPELDRYHYVSFARLNA